MLNSDEMCAKLKEINHILLKHLIDVRRRSAEARYDRDKVSPTLAWLDDETSNTIEQVTIEMNKCLW